jgi:hypothetical protein
MAQARGCGARPFAGIAEPAVAGRSVVLPRQGTWPSRLVALGRQPLSIVPSAWPRRLTTRKAGAEPALSGCRTLSASIPIPRRTEILAVLRRESDDPTLPRVAGSKEWPNRAISYAVALGMLLTGRVEVNYQVLDRHR